MRIPTLPPRIGWPLMIVCLLSISISFSVYTLIAAQSDGGPAVIENYYAKGARYNQTAALQDAGAALRLDVQVDAPGATPQLRPVVVTVRMPQPTGDTPTGDASDASDTGNAGAFVPATGIEGTISLSRPHVAGAMATVPLMEDGPGVYRQQLPIEGHGLWDVTLEGTGADGTAFQTSVRFELTGAAQ